MKKLAIIAPCILPVPAFKGGAVEELITTIINQNEIAGQFQIDLFTISDTSYENTSYNFTNIIPISLDKNILAVDRMTDKYYRTFGSPVGVRRSFDKKIISEFISHYNFQEDDYFALIIENQMSLAAELIDAFDGKRTFPIYFHMHNDVDVYRTPYYIRKLAAAGVQFIAISKYIKSQILKYENNALVHVLYNGIDLQSYPKTTKHQDEYTKFLYAGRIIPEKGLLELVAAYGKLMQMLPEEQQNKISLDIVGFSDNRILYEKKVRKAVSKCEGRINLINRLSTMEMADKYNEYDVVVMPTINEEPFGLVALETIAKGIPLITTNSGALPEVVGDGAIIVDKNNDFINSLAIEMYNMILNPRSRESLGIKGCEWAKNTIEFSIDSYYDRLVRFIDYPIGRQKMSIIVPVYNVENQLYRCVDSLIHQTYADLEIILVDDGSTDSSGTMCDDLASKDSRIRVIHQSNRGLSGARNSGLDIMTGEYVFFVDSDDYIAKDTIEKLYMLLQRHNADIMACGFSHVFDGNEPEEAFTSNAPGVWNGHDSIIQMMRTNNICTVAWNKLYRSTLWENIRFPEGRVHEDEATTYKLLYKAKIEYPKMNYKNN